MKARRASVAALAAAAIGLLGACTSQPGPKTVAMDYVDGMFTEGDITQSERDCMLEKLDAYSDADLEQLGEANVDVNFAGAETVPANATPELKAFVDDLNECVDSA